MTEICKQMLKINLALIEDIHDLLARDKGSRKSNVGNAILGVAAVSGVSAAVAGAGALSSVATTTAIVSGVGATVLGGAGALIGSTVGIATGGTAMAATIPLAAGGITFGSLLGPIAAFFGLITSPAWALPALAGGAVVAVSATAVGVYKGLTR